MALTVAVFNFKGGTGKSTTAENLGACLASKKLKVLLIDLDGQRTLSFNCGVDGATPTALDWLTSEVEDEIAPIETKVKRLDIIPGDIGMFQLRPSTNLIGLGLNRIRPLYDVVLMDCPPSLSEIASQALLACDRVLMPTLCQPAALKGTSEAIQLIRGDAPTKPIDVLRVWYEANLVLTDEADEMLIAGTKKLNYNLLLVTIPKNVRIAEAVAHQQPITNYAPKSTGARAYKKLASECVANWGIKK